MHLRDVIGGFRIIYFEAPCFDCVCAHRVCLNVFYEPVNWFSYQAFIASLTVGWLADISLANSIFLWLQP
jgi:hypothetical protein